MLHLRLHLESLPGDIPYMRRRHQLCRLPNLHHRPSHPPAPNLLFPSLPLPFPPHPPLPAAACPPGSPQCSVLVLDGMQWHAHANVLPQLLAAIRVRWGAYHVCWLYDRCA